MPKVDYEKEPFRLCRWNTRPHKFRGFYHCSYTDDFVDKDYCMRCFHNDWYRECEYCHKQVLKTEINRIFELDILAMSYVCDDCYLGQEMVNNESESEKEIIYDINRWLEKQTK